jgi:hypothetical protein
MFNPKGFTQYIEEAVKLSDFRKHHKNIKNYNEYLHKRYASVFAKHIKDNPNNTKFRLFFPFKKDVGKIEPIQEIVELLNIAGYEILDYYTGKVQKGKEQTTIGKVLGKLEKSSALDKTLRTDDPKKLQKAKEIIEKHKSGTSLEHQYRDQMNSFGKKDTSTNVDYSIVISRHFYDMIGQSEDREWMMDSCKRLTSGGSNQHYIPTEYGEGWLIAYLVRSKDVEISNKYKASDHFDKKHGYSFTSHHSGRIDPLKDPVARVLIIPYENAKDSSKVRLFVSKEQVYGSNVPGFVDRVEEILYDAELRKSNEVFGSYTCDNSKGYVHYAIEKRKTFEMEPKAFEKFVKDSLKDFDVKNITDTNGSNYIQVEITQDELIAPFCKLLFGASVKQTRILCSPERLKSEEDMQWTGWWYADMGEQFREFCYDNNLDVWDKDGDFKNDIYYGEVLVNKFVAALSSDMAQIIQEEAESRNWFNIMNNDDFTKLYLKIPTVTHGLQGIWIQVVNELSKQSDKYFTTMMTAAPNIGVRTSFNIFKTLSYESKKWWIEKVGVIPEEEKPQRVVGKIDYKKLLNDDIVYIFIKKSEYNDLMAELKADGYKWSGDTDRDWDSRFGSHREVAINISAYNRGRGLTYSSLATPESREDCITYDDLNRKYREKTDSSNSVGTINFQAFQNAGFRYVHIDTEAQFNTVISILKTLKWDNIDGVQWASWMQNGLALNISRWNMDEPYFTYSRDEEDSDLVCQFFFFSEHFLIKGTAKKESPPLEFGRNQAWIAASHDEYLKLVEELDKTIYYWDRGEPTTHASTKDWYEMHDLDDNEAIVVYIEASTELAWDQFSTVQETIDHVHHQYGTTYDIKLVGNFI